MIDQHEWYALWWTDNSLNKESPKNFWKWQLNLRSGKTYKGHGKSHGKSWNLKSLKEYERSPAILTKQAWSFKCLLYGLDENLSLVGPMQEILSKELGPSSPFEHGFAL